MLKKIIKSNIDKGQDQGLMKEDIGNIRKREADQIQKKKIKFNFNYEFKVNATKINRRRLRWRGY